SYPLRLVARIGLATIVISMILLGWALFDAFFRGSAPQGWASTIIVVLFMSAVQLFGIAILGEYLRLIFLEVKGRPTYIVRNYKCADGGRDGPFDPLETQL